MAISVKALRAAFPALELHDVSALRIDAIVKAHFRTQATETDCETAWTLYRDTVLRRLRPRATSVSP